MAIRHRTIAGILAAAALTLWSSRCKNEVTGVSPPPPAAVDIRGTWKGTFSGTRCAPVSASATFSQSNNVVSATLQPGASCVKNVTLEATVTETGLTGGVWFTQGPPEDERKYRGNVKGSVSSSAMTLQIDRLCDTANAELPAGCVDGGTLVLNKSS